MQGCRRDYASQRLFPMGYCDLLRSASVLVTSSLHFHVNMYSVNLSRNFDFSIIHLFSFLFPLLHTCFQTKCYTQNCSHFISIFLYITEEGMIKLSELIVLGLGERGGE